MAEIFISPLQFPELCAIIKKNRGVRSRAERETAVSDPCHLIRSMPA